MYSNELEWRFNRCLELLRQPQTSQYGDFSHQLSPHPDAVRPICAKSSQTQAFSMNWIIDRRLPGTEPSAEAIAQPPFQPVSES